MTDDQAGEIYHGLVQILREEGLDWIVDEVEAVIREGKVEKSKVKLKTPSDQRNLRQVFRHSRRNWTSEERLAILLDAVDAAVCKSVIMESDLVALLPELEGGKIEFAPGGFAVTELGGPLSRRDEQYSLQFDQARHELQTNAKWLSGLLQTVRRDLNADLD